MEKTTKVILYKYKGAVDLYLTHQTIFQILHDLNDLFVFKKNPIYPSRKGWSLGLKYADGSWRQFNPRSELQPYLNERGIKILNDSGRKGDPAPYAMTGSDIASIMACLNSPDQAKTKLSEIPIKNLYEAKGKLWGVQKRLGLV